MKKFILSWSFMFGFCLFAEADREVYMVGNVLQVFEYLSVNDEARDAFYDFLEVDDNTGRVILKQAPLSFGYKPVAFDQSLSRDINLCIHCCNKADMGMRCPSYCPHIADGSCGTCCPGADIPMKF